MELISGAMWKCRGGFLLLRGITINKVEVNTVSNKVSFHEGASSSSSSSDRMHEPTQPHAKAAASQSAEIRGRHQ